MTSARQAHLIGGGIANLSAAVYLIRDGGLPGAQITIYEAREVNGGSLDGSGNAQDGYVIRGGRMLNFSYLNTYELLASIPSLDTPGRSVRDEIAAFNERVKTHAQARIVTNGQPLSVETLSHMGFSARDRLDLAEMVVSPESRFDGKRIDECFGPAFLETHFWIMWATMFGFEPWHSALEFKRYLHRFIHEFPRLHTLAGVDRTPLNQYDAIVRPIEAWLRTQGVRFESSAIVTALDFHTEQGRHTVAGLRYRQGGQALQRKVAADDMVFLTNGSMTAGSTQGSMHTPARIDTQKPHDWLLWEQVARGRRGFGMPQAFDDHPGESYWPSFTVTCRDPAFFQRMEAMSGNVAGTGALCTLRDSSWLMSIVLAHQPHFRDQPEGVQVFWGYGLYPDKPGDFVKKTMTDCSGAEILTELLSHLRFTDLLPAMLETATCIPVAMPYITSQFLVRRQGDRPAVIPKESVNLAFVSQFCEQPDDTVFTVEYSVRAARSAVYQFMQVDKEIPPIYRGDRDPKVIIDAIRTSFG